MPAPQANAPATAPRRRIKPRRGRLVRAGNVVRVCHTLLLCLLSPLTTCPCTTYPSLPPPALAPLDLASTAHIPSRHILGTKSNICRRRLLLREIRRHRGHRGRAPPYGNGFHDQSRWGLSVRFTCSYGRGVLGVSWWGMVGRYGREGLGMRMEMVMNMHVGAGLALCFE